MNIFKSLQYIIGLARAQSREAQAKLAYQLGYDAATFARNSQNWVDDEVAGFTIDNADDARQGLIDGLSGAANNMMRKTLARQIQLPKPNKNGPAFRRMRGHKIAVIKHLYEYTLL